MEPLNINSTLNSLEISLNAESGKLVFNGRSYPENSTEFFKPVNEWLEKYIQHPAAKTECFFNIEYLNSASRKCLFSIFGIIESLEKSHPGSVTVLWNYEEDDPDIMEMGEEYKKSFKLNFKLERIA